MVVHLASSITTALIAQADEAPRLEPADGARLLMAMMGLVILGLGLVLMAWLGARATRRYMNSGNVHSRKSKFDQDDWARKPINED